MSVRARLGALAAVFQLVALGTVVAGVDTGRADPAPLPTDSYVVVYRESQGLGAGRQLSVIDRTRDLERAYGFRSQDRFRHALRGFSARLDAAALARLRADPSVASVTPDRTLRAARVPTSRGEQVPTGVSRIGAVTDGGAHQASTTNVAVIDTGVALRHPDLNAVAGKNCAGAGPPQDDNGHGTFVAGVIGARNNGAGVIGVAPDTRVYAVKALNANGEALVSDVLCGIDWVTANGGALGIRVANLSFGGAGNYGGCSADPLHLAICNSTAAGIVYVVAAGNESADVGVSPPEIPGSYPEVLAVTATADSDGRPGGLGRAPRCAPGETDDYRASFSNFATRPIDMAHIVAAPGVCIRSTSLNGSYVTDSGTSAAAPHVAGVVALCMGQRSVPGPCAQMTPAETIQQIRADALANATATNGFVGDPAHTLGPYFGYQVSALDPSVRRISARHVPAGVMPAGSAIDLVVRVAKRQRIGRLRAVVEVGQPAWVSAFASVRLGARRRGSSSRRASFMPVTRAVPPHRRTRLRLRLPRSTARTLRRELRRRHRLVALVTVTAHDGAGNVRAEHRRVRLIR